MPDSSTYVMRAGWLGFTIQFNVLVSLQIFDFVNVQSVHNATFLAELPPTFAAQSYYYANFHENGVFTDASPDGIGNSA